MTNKNFEIKQKIQQLIKNNNLTVTEKINDQIKVYSGTNYKTLQEIETKLLLKINKLLIKNDNKQANRITYINENNDNENEKEKLKRENELLKTENNKLKDEIEKLNVRIGNLEEIEFNNYNKINSLKCKKSELKEEKNKLLTDNEQLINKFANK